VQVDTYKAEYMSKCVAEASGGASAHAAAGLATAGSDASVYALVSQPGAGAHNIAQDAPAQVWMPTFGPDTCPMQYTWYSQSR